jgi:DNA-binding NarL/FixJ family response regulator
VTEALAACGRAAETRALVARWGRDLRNLDAPLGPPALAYARGVLATSPEEAAHELTAAAAQYEALRCPYEAALACERAATRLLRAGGPAGYAPLRTAVTVYRRLGAAWDAARAARLARRHGVRVPARHGGGRRGYGSALSPREREVAELAALGRSNKEIAADLYLSVHTVARHVTAAMRKLGVRSRAGIAHRLAGDSEQA